MTEHVSTSKMERFCLSALPEPQLANITDHLTQCQACHQLLANTLREQRGTAHLNFPLEPEFWLRHDHIEFESLLNILENNLDATDREVSDAHLTTCTECREDVASFLEFTKQIEPELRVRYGPSTKEPRQDANSWWKWWRGLAWRPAYTAAAVLLGIAAVIAAALLLKPVGTQNLQTQQVPTPTLSPGGGSDDRTAGVPSPSVAPTESPEKTSAAEAVVVLNDQGRTITVHRDGNVFGIDDVPAPTRDQIATVLLTDKLDPPPILKELGGQNSALRGGQDVQSFKLLSPARTVITSNRPVLKWEKAARATSYKVYVTDQAGNEVAKSNELSSDSTSWFPPKPLKRGEIYSWTVVGVVDGKEVVSPGPAAPEMKFQVLSASLMKQLARITKTRSQIAAAIFYAKMGMLAEAEREFRSLQSKNSNSTVPSKLLRQIQSGLRVHGRELP